MVKEISNSEIVDESCCSNDGLNNLNEESGLEGLKKEYNVFREKYDLPDFSKLNELFEIEDLESCETEFLLKKIRKIVADRLSSYVRFIEIILNPANAPMFFFKLIKRLDEEDKQRLNEIYEDFGKLEISVVLLDLDYNEEKEAEFIKKMFDKFNESRFDILKVVEKMGNGGGNMVEDKGRSYFG